MRLAEHGRELHADGGQLVDVEEAAVVDLLGGDAPVRETVRLLVEQPVEVVEAPRVAALAVADADRLLDATRAPARSARPAAGRRRRITSFSRIRSARALGARVSVDGGQVRERGEDALVLLDVAGRPRRAAPRGPPGGDARICRRGSRLERAAPSRSTGCGRRRRRTRGVSSWPSSTRPYWSPRMGKQHLAGEVALDRVPVDVEELRVGRAGTVLEHVVPPPVGGLPRCPCGSARRRGCGPCRAPRSAPAKTS